MNRRKSNRILTDRVRTLDPISNNEEDGSPSASAEGSVQIRSQMSLGKRYNEESQPEHYEANADCGMRMTG